jgi:hypothetical protein
MPKPVVDSLCTALPAEDDGMSLPTDFVSEYPSKRDSRIQVVIWMGAVVLAIPSIAILKLPILLVVRLGLSLFYMIFAIFCIRVLYSTTYILTDAHLIVRCGPFRWRIPLDAIIEVTPSRSMASAPACSLGRLLVRHLKSKPGLLISPVKKNDFLRDLGERCPHMRLKGDSLLSRGDT